MPANSGIIKGGDIMLYVNTGTVAVPVWTKAAHATEHTISHKAELRERVTKQTGKFKSRVSGKLDTTISVSSLAGYDTYNYFELLALMHAGAPVLLKYSGRPAADVTAGEAETAEATGDKYFQGSFCIESLERNDPATADSTMSATFQQAAAPEIKTVSS
jgi:hypothetical protein